MINPNKIVSVIEGYKQYFPEHWEDEKYKWEAVKHFQDNWDIEAENFGAMFKKATDKTFNLLASGYAYPRGMILEFAKADENAVREMFRRLFDESLDLSDRVTEFMNTAEKLRIKYNDGTWKQHYQNTNYISTYLWLMYPDKYYIYKYELYRAVAKELDDSYLPKKNGAAETMVGGFKMYDEICEILNRDTELRQMLESALTDSCYKDSQLKTMTIDFGFYLARFYKKQKITRCWFVGAYNDSDDTHQDEEFIEQGIWQNGYTDKFLDTVNSVKVGDKIAIKTSYTKKKGLPFDNKGATISVMKIKIVGTVTANHMDGRTLEVDWDTSFKPKEWYFYTFRNTITLPKEDDWRTKALYDFLFNDATQNYDLFSVKDQPMKIYEAIAAVLENTGRSMNIDEIYDAIVAENLYQFDAKDRERKGKVDTALKRHCLDVDISEKSNNILFYISSVDNGTNYYSLITDKNNQGNDLLPSSNSEFLKYFAPLIQAIKELGGSATRKEAHEKVIELMDITEEELSVTYEKTGASRVLNQIDFARNDLAHEGFISSGTKGVWALTELGMNIDMTMELAGLIHMKWVKINTAKRKGEPIPEIDLSKHYKKKIDRKYTKEDFLKDVFLTEPEYDKLRSLVLRKKNIILQGAPGVGKTFSAKRLAYSIIGEKNENRICMVQFHQNYSYEDFIMGYRPNDSGGFELQSGVFFNFCERCKENPDKPYFFIIDEINRGNLSKIFGELLMLIETDKRGEKHKLNLVYGGTAFYIPENLHIIGMMNTADRSLAMIDYALRRRFSFYTMQPAFENADQNGFGAYTQDISCDLYHSVITKIRELNDTIRKDSTLGKGFEIGHSYFAPENKSDIDDKWVRGVVEYEIIPLIEEYWFDDDKKVDEWTKALYQVIGD